MDPSVALASRTGITMATVVFHIPPLSAPVETLMGVTPFATPDRRWQLHSSERSRLAEEHGPNRLFKASTSTSRLDRTSPVKHVASWRVDREGGEWRRLHHRPGGVGRGSDRLRAATLLQPQVEVGGRRAGARPPRRLPHRRV